MKRIHEDVAKYGWHVVAVTNTAPSPEFAFSVGLFQTYDHPELVVFGLRMNAAHRVIAACVERIEEGAVFEDGQVRSDILIELDAAILTVEKTFYPEYLGSAIGFYDGTDFSALQVVWPDRANHFPWEAEYDPTFSGTQVILSRLAT